MRARGPDGTRWRVTRRWLHWRPRVGRALSSPPGQDDMLDRLALAGGARPFGAPNTSAHVWGTLERLLLLLALPVTLLLRALGLTTYAVVVHREHETVAEHRVRGWGASRRAVAEIVDAIEHGRPPPRPGQTGPP